MNINEYLKAVLKNETLKEDSAEFKALIAEEKKVRKLLETHFADVKPAVRTGGSRAKGTMIKSNYDLDITCYFDRADDEAGDTLEDIFENVKTALESEYLVTPKTSSLRLESRDVQTKGKYTHVDVVPGRFIDEDKETSDVFLHQTNGKDRLKTNLQTHINLIRDSERQEVIRLLKLWKIRNGLGLKTFVLELMAVEVLTGTDAISLEGSLRAFWETIEDAEAQLTIEDPANPEGNDLSQFLAEHRQVLSVLASQALSNANGGNWEAVFGAAEALNETEKYAAVTSFARTNPSAPLPHAE